MQTMTVWGLEESPFLLKSEALLRFKRYPFRRLPRDGANERRAGPADRQRIGRYLERQGLLERDAENSYLVGDELDAGPLEHLLGSSITYRVTVGPQGVHVADAAGVRRTLRWRGRQGGRILSACRRRGTGG